MSNKLNPQIQTMEIGVKSLRLVTIYPLSMADQFKLSDIISEAIRQYSNPDSKYPEESPEESPEEPQEDKQKDNASKTEVEMFRSIIKLIEENLIEILSLITDDNDKIELDDLTNIQFTDLCIMIYETNFETAAGKLRSLFGKVKNVMKKPLASKRPRPKSSLKQPINTDTSSDSHSEMGE